MYEIEMCAMDGKTIRYAFERMLMSIKGKPLRRSKNMRLLAASALQQEFDLLFFW